MQAIFDARGWSGANASAAQIVGIEMRRFLGEANRFLSHRFAGYADQKTQRQVPIGAMRGSCAGRNPSFSNPHHSKTSGTANE